MLSGSEATRDHDQAEIRLMGLILMQAVSIGIAIGVFDAKLWIDLQEPAINGITYAMAAFAVQGLAYYLFKMFFQQGMDEKARIASQERERRSRYRHMEMSFDRRRQDMELRMQEAQMDNELRWMEDNPGKSPPWIQQRVSSESTGTGDFQPIIPTHEAEKKQALNLGLSYDDEKSSTTRGSDGKFKKKDD